MKQELAKGAIYTTRSAGSHSHYDVISIREGTLFLYQVKSKKEKVNALVIPERLEVKQRLAVKGRVGWKSYELGATKGLNSLTAIR